MNRTRIQREAHPALFDLVAPRRPTWWRRILDRAWPWWVIALALAVVLAVFWGSSLGAGFLIGRWTA